MPTAKENVAKPKSEFEAEAWVKLGKQFLDESKVDLVISAKLADCDDSGCKRRRLYFLQQALEKCIKNMMPSIGMELMGIPYWSSFDMMIAKNIPSKPLAILMERGEHIFLSFRIPKGLAHDPVQRLEVKAFLEDCYLFAVSVDNVEWATTCQTCMNLIEEKDLGVILRGINAQIESMERIQAEGERQGVPENTLAALERIHAGQKPKPVSPEFAKVSIDLARAGAVVDTKLVCLRLALLGLLAGYEQSSRYPPGNDIPKKLLESLNQIHDAVQKIISEAEKGHEVGAFDLRDLSRFLLDYGRTGTDK